MNTKSKIPLDMKGFKKGYITLEQLAIATTVLIKNKLRRHLSKTLLLIINKVINSCFIFCVNGTLQKCV